MENNNKQQRKDEGKKEKKQEQMKQKKKTKKNPIKMKKGIKFNGQTKEPKNKRQRSNRHLTLTNSDASRECSL